MLNVSCQLLYKKWKREGGGGGLYIKNTGREGGGLYIKQPGREGGGYICQMLIGIYQMLYNSLIDPSVER